LPQQLRADIQMPGGPDNRCLIVIHQVLYMCLILSVINPFWCKHFCTAYRSSL